MSRLSNLSYKEFCKYIEGIGCVHDRTGGDHFVYIKPGLARPLVVPMCNPLPEFIISNNLRILGISKKEFKKTLAKEKKRKSKK